MPVLYSLLPLLLLLLLAASAANAAMQPAGKCYCVNKRFVNIRSTPCGTIIGNTDPGYNYLSLGGSTSLCGRQWLSASGVNGSIWFDSEFVDACPDSRCISSCPPIISRGSWGARPPKRTTLMRRPAPYMFVHATIGARCSGLNGCTAELKRLQDQDMDSMGLDDIKYSFLISDDGSIFEGAGWYTMGYHTELYSDDGYALSFMGNFATSAPTRAAQQAAQRLLDCGVAAGHLRARFALRARSDMLPGDNPGLPIYNIIRQWSDY